jgi:N4-gp56 family major capsid protein
VATITTSSLPPAVILSYSNKLLSVPVPNLIHTIPAMRKTKSRNSGDVERMRRYNPLATAVVPLGNSGVTPPALSSSVVDIDAKINYYGAYLYVNEQVVLQNQEDVLNEFSIRLGISLRQTEDELTRNMLAATASMINCTGGVNGDNPTEITVGDVDTVTTTLLGNNANTISSAIEGADKFGSAPVRNAYFALCHTDMTKALNNTQTFIHNAQYPSPDKVLPSEWGAVGNVRFLVSSIGSFATAASNLGRTVYDAFVMGMEAYTIIEQDGYSANFIYLDAKYSGPLAQNVSLGYKIAAAFAITNDQWIVKLRSTLP